MAAHPELWKKCSKMVLIQAYGMLVPTLQCVLEMIKEPEFKNSQEQSVFDYLRRFIILLKKGDLCKLLRFITGKPHCPLQQVTITYHSDSHECTRRPVSHTCSAVLSLPTSYATTTFSTFNKEFQNILDNSALWAFDTI